MGFLEGMEWMASHLNLFELHNLQLEMESGLLSFFFFKEDNFTLLCWNILNFFGVLNGKLGRRKFVYGVCSETYFRNLNVQFTCLGTMMTSKTKLRKLNM